MTISLRQLRLIVLFASFLSLVSIASLIAQDSGTTTRVSVASDRTEGNGDSKYPAISADGRLLAFTSRASNLVADDSSPVSDVFVHERATGTTRRVSVASDGSEANSLSYWPSLSADGRYVVFWSGADNLVDGDVNGHTADVFVHELETAQTTLVSLASDGTGGNSASAGATLSADGRYVAFSSFASNLVENDTNDWWDVFVKDRQSGQIVRVSVASDGTQGNENSSGYDPPSISADGTVVTFWSLASNLVENDTGGYRDVFAHDLTTGQTTRVSVASDGTPGNYHSSGFVWPVISADGRTVAFRSDASNLVENDTNSFGDIFVHDLTSRETSRVSVASDGTQATQTSWRVSLSANGRKVAFASKASNLVDNDTNWVEDIFIHERETGQTSRISVASDGTQANNGSGSVVISADGQHVAFNSVASNLVENDTNEESDVFVHVRPDERATPTVSLTSTPPNTATPTNTIPPNSETPTSTTTSTSSPIPTACSTPPTPSSTSSTTVTPTLMASLTPTLMASPSATTSYRLYLPLLLH